MDWAKYRQIDLGTERIDDHRHERSRGRYDRRQKIDEARGFVGNDVFFENKFDEFGEWLKKTARPHTVWSQPSLNKTEYTTLGKHRVRDHRHHDKERYKDTE